MNALTLRTLCTLPAGLQQQIRADRHNDLDEFVQAAAQVLLEGKRGDTMATLFKSARSAARCLTQDLAHRCRPLDGVAEISAVGNEPSALCRSDITREIAREHGITPSRGRQIVARQIEWAKVSGDCDLFLE